MTQTAPDILAIILKAAEGGITKAGLLTESGLEGARLRRYVTMLLQKKLMMELADEDKKHRAYRTTQKGIGYLVIYSFLKEIAVFPER
jgi:predicted transcriptional regulator